MYNKECLSLNILLIVKHVISGEQTDIIIQMTGFSAAIFSMARKRMDQLYSVIVKTLDVF